MAGPLSASAPVAIFDSGVGGLSVARHIRARLPAESLLYVADSAYAPYGARSDTLIRARAHAISAWLAGAGAKAVVVACNTATTLAVASLRAAHPQVPFVGVEPGLKPAMALSSSHVVGVLATEAALRSASFNALLAQYSDRCRYVCQAGHGLVELIERGEVDTPQMQALLARYLDPMAQAGVDVVVLGCTHFPLLIDAITRRYGDTFRLIDTGEAVARRLSDVLHDHGLSAPEGAPGGLRLVATGASARLAEVAAWLLPGAPLPECHPMDHVPADLPGRVADRPAV